MRFDAQGVKLNLYRSVKMSVVADTAPRTTRGDQRRQAILDIARETFLREGYAAASMSAIGARAGGSKATLYTYFPSKADLFAAVMADMCAQNRLELTSETDAAPDLETALRRLGRRYIDLMLSDELVTLHRLVVAESVRFPELGEALYAVGPQLGKATLAERLRRFIDAGALRAGESLHLEGGFAGVDGPAFRMAGQFFDLCLSGLYRRRLWNIAQPITEADKAANVEAAVTVFMRAYAA